MKRLELIPTLTISLFLLISCNSDKNREEAVKNTPSINKEFITLNSIQIGDNIGEHKNFILSNEKNNFFDIYINKEKTTINKLEGDLLLFVSNSVIEKIEFDGSASFLGSTNVAGAVFDAMLETRKNWIRDAMLNYNISEWDESNTISEYVKHDFLHQYSLKPIEFLGIQMGWSMSYVITSKNAEIKEKQGRKNNLDFGSTKDKSDLKENSELEVEKAGIKEANIQNRNENYVQSGNSNQKPTETFIINVDNLRVRTTPNLDSEKIESLSTGSEVEFIEKSENQSTVTIGNNEITEYWYKVKTPSGIIGWIHGCCFDK